MRQRKRGGFLLSRAAVLLILVVVVAIAFADETRAQGARPTDGVAAALDRMQAEAGAPLKTRRSALTGMATFVSSRGRGIPVQDRGTPLGRAQAFLDAHGPAFGLRDSTQVREGRSAGRDRLGIDHVRMQQVVNDVPVVGAELMVHLRGAEVMAAHGKTLPGLEGFDTQARVSEARAQEIVRGFAEHRLGAKDPWLSEPRLEILNKGIFDGHRQPTVLAWFVEARGPKLREFVWVDAWRGSVALHFSQLDKGVARPNRTIYDADSSYTLPGNLMAEEGYPPAADADAIAAYNFTGDTWDYFWQEHNRYSYDELGGALVSTVHYCPYPSACPYQNAYWDGAQMVYGEGFSRADDVTAHELTHAVTEHSANLFYYMQSGALNESISDIFGETVDQWNTDRGDQTRRGNDSASVRWLMGEDVPGIGAIRNMMNPNQFGDPGKTSDPQFYCANDDYYGDNGGVHRNSGVPNHAYALMVDGGTYNSITVTGIGLKKAAKIQYRTLTNYLSSASDFLDYYDAVQQACSDLTLDHASGITPSDCTQVQHALDAVQLAAPSLCNQAVPPSTCPAGKVKAASDLFFDDFESGSAKWVLTQTAGPSDTAWTTDPPYLYATSGTHSLYAPDWWYDGTYPQSDVQAAMASPVTIPSGDVRLQFQHAYDMYSYANGGVVEYTTDGGTTWQDAGPLFVYPPSDGGAVPNSQPGSGPLAGRSTFGTQSGGYVTSQLDLSSLTGKNVQLRYRLGAGDPYGNLGWFVDDVRMYQCLDDPQAAISIADTSLREGNSGTRWATFTVSLSAPLSNDVTFDLVTSDGTATAGEDYAAVSGTGWTIWAGSTGTTIQVPVYGDTDVEGDETFQVTLSNVTGASVARATATGTIIDDDGLPAPPTTNTWAVARQGMPSLNKVAYGAGLYVAVDGQSGVWTSADGITWSQRQLPARSDPYHLSGIAFAGGQFVAVGSYTIVTSPDGVNWTDQSANIPSGYRYLNAVTYGQGQSAAEPLYVVVGSSGQFLTSSDAVTWTAVDTGTTNSPYAVAFGGGTFVAVGYGGVLMTSVDGTNWTVGAAPTYSLNDVTYTGTQFVVVSYNQVFTSPDGGTWTAYPFGGYYDVYAVASGPGGAIVAVGYSTFLTSPDGQSWTPHPVPTVGSGGNAILYGVTYGASGYVAVGYIGAVFTSPDGGTWTSRQMASSRFFNGLSFDGTRYCAVGEYGAAARSADGATWTNVATPPSSPGSGYYPSLAAVAHGPGLFVAVGGAILTSPDCGTWTSRPYSLPVTQYAWSWFDDVAFGGSRYVAVGQKYTGTTYLPMIQTSTDGLTWADVELPGVPAAELKAVGYGAGRYVTIGNLESGGGFLVLTSEDGLHWTQRPNQISEWRWSSVTGLRYGGGSFVVSVDGDTWTSADGIQWSMACCVGGLIYDTAFGSSRAVGVGDGAYESLDLRTWAPQSLPSEAQLNAVSYAGSLDRFLAVGESVIEYTSNALPTLSIGPASAAEDAGPMHFTVTLSAPSGNTVIVGYATKNGTAVAPADYAPTSGTLTFLPGETSKGFDVPLVADGTAEGAETFSVVLTSPTNAAIGTGTAVGTITDGASTPLPTFSIADVDLPEGTGGTTPFTFTVTLSNPGLNQSTVAYTTVDGTARAPADYAPTSGVLTFPTGVTSQTITVQVVADDIHEADETFTVKLSAPSNATISKATGLGTIRDDDTGGAIEFTSAAYTVKEAAGVATITVKRTGSVAAGESVVYATSDGTALAGSDYTARTSTLTFPAGVQTLSFTVPITPDTIAEGPETVNLTLSGAGGGARLGTLTNAVLTIVDDDFGGTVKFSAATYSVSETAGTATITVVRTAGAASGVSVDYAAMDNSAVNGSDYTLAPGTLSFGAGVMSRTITVPITNDTLAEGDETFNIMLSNPRGGAILGTPASAVVTIKDDEPVVQFSTSGYTVSEAGGSATITVVRTGTTGPCSVQYTVSDGSATLGSDYNGPTTGTLSFAAGALSRTFTVPIINDTIAESSETVFLTLSNPVNASIGARRTAVLTIKDDEPVVQFSSAAYTVSEAAGKAVLTITRTGTAGIWVWYQTSDGSAQDGTDYVGAGQWVWFAPGVLAKTISIPILNNPTSTSNHYFWVDLYPDGQTSRVGARYYAYVMITDNSPTVRFSASAYTVSEAAGHATLTVTRTGTAPMSVDYWTTDGSASAGSDYQSVSGTLSFPAGVTSKTITVPIILDGVYDPDEYFYVVLTSPVGAKYGTPNWASVTIKEASPAVRFSSATYTGAEGTNATITVTRTGTVPISVGYATSDGTATTPGHYTSVSGTLSFPAGVTTKTFPVPIQSDGVPDPYQTVNLTLSNPVGAYIGSPAMAVLTIMDPTPVLQFSATAYSVSEAAGAATITVTRSGTARTACSVQYATSDGTATAGSDYTAVSNTLTFAAGILSRTFTVPILNDTVGEPTETVSLKLSNPSAGCVIGPRNAAVLSINDNEPVVQFSATAYSVSEAGGAATITVVRTGSLAPFSVQYTTSDGTATAGSDYTTASGTLSFPAGVLSKTFTVPIINDTLHEANETVQLGLLGASGAVIGPRATAVLTIIDNDVAGTIAFGAPVFDTEQTAGTATVTVTRSAGAASGVTVDFATVDGTATAPADYQAVTSTLVFAAGETTKTISIPVANHGVPGPSQTVLLTLSNPSSGAALGVQKTATLVIVD